MDEDREGVGCSIYGHGANHANILNTMHSYLLTRTLQPVETLVKAAK